ncbi:MAG: hypothetical protein Q9227_007839 [Pyrenula ochraceoflavens]
MASASTALKETKQHLRKTIGQRVRALTPEQVQFQSKEVCERVLKMPQYQRASNIGVYLSMPNGEILTNDIVNHALENGKKVFVPFIHGAKGASRIDMLALTSKVDYESLDQDAWGIPSLKQESIARRENALGGWGIEESRSQRPLLDIIVLPGVAFDVRKARLGHGKGYYDRYLQEYRACLPERYPQMPYLVGIALQEQLLGAEESIPTDSTDWYLDEIVVHRN